MNESEELREQFALSITLGGLMLKRESLLKDIETGRTDVEGGVKRVRAVEAAILCLDPDASFPDIATAFGAPIDKPKLKTVLMRHLKATAKPMSALRLAVAIGQERGISTNDLGAVRSLAEDIDNCLSNVLAEGRLARLRGSRDWAWVMPRVNA